MLKRLKLSVTRQCAVGTVGIQWNSSARGQKGGYIGTHWSLQRDNYRNTDITELSTQEGVIKVICGKAMCNKHYRFTMEFINKVSKGQLLVPWKLTKI
jgi:hypothetical protein